MRTAFQKEVLRVLRKHGSDTTKPHIFEFHVYLPSRARAKMAADKIRQNGFSEAEVSRAGAGRKWLCAARKRIIPQKADLEEQARFFQQLADALGGQFDGWEAELI